MKFNPYLVVFISALIIAGTLGLFSPKKSGVSKEFRDREKLLFESSQADFPQKKADNFIENLFSIEKSSHPSKKNTPEGVETGSYLVSLNNVDPVLTLSRKLNIQETSQIARLETEVNYKIQEAISKILLALPRGATVSATFSKVTAAVLLDGLTKKQCKQIVAAGLGKECYPNHRVTINLDKNIKQINAHKAWKEKDRRGQPITGRNTKIAIVDTGVDATHPDLEGKVIAEHCFLHEKVGSCPNGFSEMHGRGAAVDENGHGTHVASIAAGTGRASEGRLRGVAPDAKLIALKVFDEDGDGLESDVIRAIEKAVEYKPDVINLSLGSSSYYYSDCYQSLLSLVIDRVVASGIPVVVGAGNSGEAGDLTVDVPGCAKNAITVGASFGDDVAWFSSVGPAFGRYFKPDIVAPGVDVCAARASSVDPARARSFSDDGPYMQLSGTSMATPFVSGLVALLKQKNPKLSPSQIKHNLRRNASQLKTSILNQGYGRIDAFKSVQDTTALPITVRTEGVVKGLVKVKFFPIYTGVYQIEYGPKILEPKRKGKLICKLDTRGKSSVPQICNWNTRLLNDGLYSLRVTFTDPSGRKSQDTTLVLVRNKPNTYLNCETCLDCSLLLSWPESSVNLIRDLTDFSKACIRISGDDTSLDCNQKEFKQNVNAWAPPGIFTNSERVKIRHCKFTNLSSPLILFYPGKRITAENNLITNPVYGITLALVQNVSLVENKVLVDDYSFFRRGLYFLDLQTKLSQDSLLDYSDHSIDTSNTINGKPIYYLFNQYGTVLSNLEVGGVFIRGGANNTIDNVRIVGGDGINIFASSNNRVLNNYLENNSYALTLGPKSNNNLIQSNIFRNYQFYAIVGENKLEEVSSVSNKIFDNSFILDFRDRYESSFVGIFFEKNFLNTEIRNNNFVNSLQEGVGIATGAASGLIQGNRIQGQETGIALRVASGFPLILRNNQIRSNKIGLRISYQSSPGDFIFQHNSITNNEKQIRASLSDSTLELSYQRQGNFWGRASPPLFCKPSNPHPSCSENPDSNSDQVVDSCPYNRDYSAGEWPRSPECP